MKPLCRFVDNNGHELSIWKRTETYFGIEWSTFETAHEFEPHELVGVPLLDMRGVSAAIMRTLTVWKQKRLPHVLLSFHACPEIPMDSAAELFTGYPHMVLFDDNIGDAVQLWPWESVTHLDVTNLDVFIPVLNRCTNLQVLAFAHVLRAGDAVAALEGLEHLHEIFAWHFTSGALVVMSLPRINKFSSEDVDADFNSLSALNASAGEDIEMIGWDFRLVPPLDDSIPNILGQRIKVLNFTEERQMPLTIDGSNLLRRLVSVHTVKVNEFDLDVARCVAHMPNIANLHMRTWSRGAFEELMNSQGSQMVVHMRPVYLTDDDLYRSSRALLLSPRIAAVLVEPRKLLTLRGDDASLGVIRPLMLHEQPRRSYLRTALMWQDESTRTSLRGLFSSLFSREVQFEPGSATQGLSRVTEGTVIPRLIVQFAAPFPTLQDFLEYGLSQEERERLVRTQHPPFVGESMALRVLARKIKREF